MESLLKQTIPTNYIVIVCDGKLTNELNEIINEYDSKYPDLFNIFRYDENKGLGYALSQGIKLTKNDVVMRMDTDDVCLPHRAETQLPLMKKYSLVGSWITEFDGEETNIFSTRKVPEYYRDIYKFAKKDAHLITLR